MFDVIPKQSRAEREDVQKQVDAWRAEQTRNRSLVNCNQPGTTYPITQDACHKFRDEALKGSKNAASRPKLINCTHCSVPTDAEKKKIQKWLDVVRLPMVEDPDPAPDDDYRDSYGLLEHAESLLNPSDQ